MFIIDTLYPKSPKDLYFNKAIFNKIIKNKLYNNNLYFHSNITSGKKTLINMLLKHIYGYNYKLRKIVYQKKNKEVNIDITYYSSDYHIEIYPTNLGIDKYIIKDIILTYVKTRLIEYDRKKYIVIHNVDKLINIAQAALRRIMEKYNVVFILSGKSIIEPLVSRCIKINVKAPTEQELFFLLSDYILAKKKPFDSFALINIIKQSERNIKKCIWLLELYLLEIETILDYEKEIDKLIEFITNSEPITNISVMNIRQILYKFYVMNLDIYDICETLLKKLIKLKLPNLSKILQIFSDVNKNLYNSKKQVVHYEYLIYNLKLNIKL